jgi:hypothetical protein
MMMGRNEDGVRRNDKAGLMTTTSSEVAPMVSGTEGVPLCGKAELTTTTSSKIASPETLAEKGVPL